MFRKSVLLAFGLSISFSGFALAASEEPVSEQQAQAVEGARKINPAAVEVLLDNNRRMTLDFYGDNVFRIFRDDRGGIIRDPKAEPEARILADSPRRPVSRLDVDQQGDAVVITTGKVRIEINKKTSLFKVINLKDHSVVVEQASPVFFGKGKTSFSLKAKPDEYFTAAAYRTAVFPQGKGHFHRKPEQLDGWRSGFPHSLLLVHRRVRRHVAYLQERAV